MSMNIAFLCPLLSPRVLTATVGIGQGLSLPQEPCEDTWGLGRKSLSQDHPVRRWHEGLGVLGFQIVALPFT